MTWNWQHKDWPNFLWDGRQIASFEEQFLSQSGMLIGISKHVAETDRQDLVIDLITNEAVKTSEIEGEYLDRASVQSSVRRNFGLETEYSKADPAAQGIALLMTDVFENFTLTLTHDLLHRWHDMLMMGREDLEAIGRYRAHLEPMQIVSGRLDRPTVHFEAPPSKRVQSEMGRFLDWWQLTSRKGDNALPPLTRSGIAHLYFVCIHPFEDGNGRIGRVLSEKALAEWHGQPTLIALAQTIERDRKQYMAALDANNKELDITEWLLYFSQMVLEAQMETVKLFEFVIAKTRLYDRVRMQLNKRQEKVLARIFREGPSGFKGGLSAENYLAITQTSRATATRDLQDLVKKKVLSKKGELKSTRYYLNI